MEKNLTTGNIFKTIVYFALPYLLSYFLQTLYGMADLFIIGQFDHVDAITAVSNGSQVMHMLTVIIVGLAMGATVTISRAVGADRKLDAARAIGNTVTLFMAVSILFTLLLLLLVRPIVVLIGIPTEAVTGTTQYLIICFIGIPFITAYNIISSIFRGIGDSKTPMYFVAIACAANIVLDYVFIGFFHMGPSGAALGTTLAQTLSVIIALIFIRHRETGIHLTGKDFRPDPRVMTQILKIGIPVAVQDGCIQVAFIVITVIANHRGLNDAAAVGIVEKVISAVFLVPSSMLAAVSALAAQNIGAGKHDRAAKTLQYSILITSVYGIIISLIVQLTLHISFRHLPEMTRSYFLALSISIPISGTAFLQASISALPDISVHMENPILVLSTISLPLFWSVSRDLIWLPDIFPIRCSLWEWQRRQVLCFRF